MRFPVTCFFIICAISNCAHAAITFTVQKVGGNTPIQLGSSAVFNIFIAPDTGTISNLAGITVKVDASDTLLLGNKTAGGQFVSGTSSLFPTAAGSWLALFPGSVAVFNSNTNPAIAAFSTQQQLGTVTLGTTGATVGNYALSLSGLVAVDTTSASIGVSPPPPSLAYSIVAVPEPSSIALLGLLGTTALTRLWYKRQKSRRAV